MTTSLLHFEIKVLQLLFQLDSVYPNQAFSLGTLIIFENNFLLNLVVMLVCSENNLQQ